MTEETLVLDQGYAPVSIVPWEHAITLLVTGKCEIVEEYDREVRSTYLVIKVPAVVRLLNLFRRHKKPVKFSRISVYARDNYSCQYCGKRCVTEDLTYDHVLPRSQGGKTEWSNIVSCCIRCNGKKGGRSPAQAKMPLKKQPVQPSKQPALMIEVSRKSVPDAWRDYLYWTGSLVED